MRLDFHQLTVSAVQPDTAEAVVLNFEVPAALASVFAFTQGQYLTLRAKVHGQDLRRAYSICAGVDDGALRVAVRRVKGGVFSNWLNSELRVGDSLQVMPPQGRFLSRLRRRNAGTMWGWPGQWYHADFVHHENTAGTRTAQPLYPDLWQPAAALHHVQSRY